MWICFYKSVYAHIHSHTHTHTNIRTHARVCVLRSVPPCFSSVQKGLVPTTWCRAASAPPIPAWIATLGANQKLPAAFAVCPLSIFSNAGLNLLASLGCCIKTPDSTRSHIISFLCLHYDNSSPTQLPPQSASGSRGERSSCSAATVTPTCQRLTAALSSRHACKHWFDVLGVITVKMRKHCCSFSHCTS